MGGAIAQGSKTRKRPSAVPDRFPPPCSERHPLLTSGFYLCIPSTVFSAVPNRYSVLIGAGNCGKIGAATLQK